MPCSGKHTDCYKGGDYQQREGKFHTGPFPEKMRIISFSIHINAVGIQMNFILILLDYMNSFPADMYFTVIILAVDAA